MVPGSISILAIHKINKINGIEYWYYTWKQREKPRLFNRIILKTITSIRNTNLKYIWKNKVWIIRETWLLPLTYNESYDQQIERRKPLKHWKGSRILTSNKY